MRSAFIVSCFFTMKDRPVERRGTILIPQIKFLIHPVHYKEEPMTLLLKG